MTPPLKPVAASLPLTLLRFRCNSHYVYSPTFGSFAHGAYPLVHSPPLMPALRVCPPVSEESLSLCHRGQLLGLSVAKIISRSFPLHYLFHLHLNSGDHAFHLPKTLSPTLASHQLSPCDGLRASQGQAAAKPSPPQRGLPRFPAGPHGPSPTPTL